MFYDTLERKNAFLGYKNKKLKKLKHSNFSKGFWSKMAIFQLFFLGNINEKKVLKDTGKRKKAFLGYKKKKLKNSKNCDFSKGVKPWFWSKNGHCAIICFLSNIG